MATGHHARTRATTGGRLELRRAADQAKDQSYVLAMLNQDQLARTLFPVGHLRKEEVRAEAARRGLRTAAKPDSQDVCFIRRDEGRQRFLGDRIPLHPGGSSTAEAARTSARWRRWNWSRSASGGAWATEPTGVAAT